VQNVGVDQQTGENRENEVDDDVEDEEEILDEQEKTEKVKGECEVEVGPIGLDEMREEDLFVVGVELNID
jgi:hypothetical protein